MALIEVKDLTLRQGKVTILDNLNFTVAAAETLVVLGANGAGKTSLLHLLSGWETGTATRDVLQNVSFNGRPWSTWQQRDRIAAIQLVGQFPFYHLSGRAFTVRAEVAFGPENLALPVEEIKRRVDAALEATRLTALSDRDPFSLSGGEQQRLVMAAALALQPQCLVLDEPLTNLDPESRQHMLELLRSLSKKTTLIIGETSPSICAEVADRVLVLENGGLVALGAPADVLLDPRIANSLGLPAVSQAVLDLSGHSEVYPGLPLTLRQLENADA